MLSKDTLPVQSGFYYVNGLGLPTSTVYWLQISKIKPFITIDIKCSIDGVTFAFVEYFDGKPWRGFNHDERLGREQVGQVRFNPQESLLNHTRHRFAPAICA